MVEWYNLKTIIFCLPHSRLEVWENVWLFSWSMILYFTLKKCMLLYVWDYIWLTDSWKIGEYETICMRLYILPKILCVSRRKSNLIKKTHTTLTQMKCPKILPHRCWWKHESYFSHCIFDCQVISPLHPIAAVIYRWHLQRKEIVIGNWFSNQPKLRKARSSGSP